MGTSLAIGASSMRWERDNLIIDLHECTSPWKRQLRGTIVFRPTVIGPPSPLSLDGAGAHLWRPVAPFGRAEVRFDEPGCAFSGSGYFDTNSGDEPLEDGFSSWSWTRLAKANSARVTYDVETRDGQSIRHGLTLEKNEARPFGGRLIQELRPTSFGLPRTMRIDAAERSTLVRTLEDGPFYARSEVEVFHDGHRARGVHEVISLERLASRWVQFLIPFRARRER